MSDKKMKRKFIPAFSDWVEFAFDMSIAKNKIRKNKKCKFIHSKNKRQLKFETEVFVNKLLRNYRIEFRAPGNLYLI